MSLFFFLPSCHVLARLHSFVDSFSYFFNLSPNINHVHVQYKRGATGCTLEHIASIEISSQTALFSFPRRPGLDQSDGSGCLFFCVHYYKSSRTEYPLCSSELTLFGGQGQSWWALCSGLESVKRNGFVTARRAMLKLLYSGKKHMVSRNNWNERLLNN